jgi:hypothetical protein
MKNNTELEKDVREENWSVGEGRLNHTTIVIVQGLSQNAFKSRQ